MPFAKSMDPHACVRAIVAAIVLLAVLPDSAQAESAVCRVVSPPDWSGLTARWEGECPNGQAEGPGVLRGLSRGQVVRFYYGRMKAGQLDIGVVELPEGYVAGRFESGTVLSSEDPNLTIQAFREASAAAKFVSERFQKAGNLPSSRFYLDKARRLDEQMD